MDKLGLYRAAQNTEKHRKVINKVISVHFIRMMLLTSQGVYYRRYNKIRSITASATMFIYTILTFNRCRLTFDALFSFSFLWWKIIATFSKNFQETLLPTVFRGAIPLQENSQSMDKTKQKLSAHLKNYSFYSKKMCFGWNKPFSDWNYCHRRAVMNSWTESQRIPSPKCSD